MLYKKNYAYLVHFHYAILFIYKQLNGKVYAVGGIGAAHRGAYDPLSAGHGGKPDGGDADDCRVLYPSATVRRGDRELRN